ncbi:helix-turn-helix domain-containing protein [Herbaspirillum sp. GCM10030257]|uniref:helix-turn-helix domain-containing protein n=1 Tax=Herbaspirillum sp. GCM10030257 TaxID=3273393 RepID=UPI0036237100
MISFGRVLRQLRGKANLTQEQLGFDAHLARNYVSSIELGQKQPTISSIFKLAYAVGVRPSELLKLVEDDMQKTRP